MTRAEQIAYNVRGADQTRKAAQRACAGMLRDHRANKDVYMFTDGSRIVVCKNKVMLEFTSKTGI